MQKFLVPVDGSYNSKRALVEAREYAKNLDAEITIVNVVKNLRQYSSIGDESLTVKKTLTDKSYKILEKSLEPFDGYQVKVNTKLLKGNPAEQIIKEADEGNYDLIIMGSRGMGTFSRSILGSVSNKVLNHTDKNVLIIK